MIKETRTITVEDIEISIHIVSTTRDILYWWLDQYLDNLKNCEGFDPFDESFEIVYKDGTTDYIGSDYDGHKIRRQGIKSIVYSNPEDYSVYGDYEVNEYGVVHAK